MKVKNGKYTLSITNHKEIEDLIGDDKERIDSILEDLSRELPHRNMFVATCSHDTCWLFEIKNPELTLNIELVFTGTAK